MTTARSMTEVPLRDVRTRRIHFAYPSGSLKRHFVSGDLVMSHVVAVLSAMFPEGEDYFVRSVRRYAGQVTDPELEKQVAGFIGQEVTHGREHRELNDHLQEMGYPTRRVDRMVKRSMALQMRLLPPLVPLAVAAAFEHYTATLEETLLTDPRAQAVARFDRGSFHAALARSRGVRTQGSRLRCISGGRGFRTHADRDDASHQLHIHLGCRRTRDGLAAGRPRDLQPASSGSQPVRPAALTISEPRGRAARAPLQHARLPSGRERQQCAAGSMADSVVRSRRRTH